MVGVVKKAGVIDPEKLDKPTSDGFRPSDFMRARRPELFSDSRASRAPKLQPAVFEYHLNSLTTRKQENDFEYFARRLAERHICSNLLPQTGPVGGGDSQVDSETYPVSDEISMRWYRGLATVGKAQEPWAFAFSAKQAWRSKAQSDVQKIANTRRGYKQIYFITNQPVKDKARAEVESALKRRHRINVRILDRTWIMKCVFDNGSVDIAVEALHIEGFEAETKISGPRDLKRGHELDELEKQISDADRYRGVEYQLGEDCIRAALIARGLERPRVEIEGRFQRAETVSKKLGHHQQQLRVAYNRAWTTFWWFEDFEQFASLYGTVESLAIDSKNSNDLELLTNIWSLLATSVRTQRLDEVVANLPSRTASLRNQLNRVAADQERRNNALWAKTSLVLMDLQEAPTEQQIVSRAMSELKGIVTQMDGLISYPIEVVSKIVQELGDFLGSNAEYDNLCELLTETMGQRANDGEAGRILLARAHHKLRNRKIYDAIRLYGRAQARLAKREYRLELIAALVGAGLAYESAGLLWAARANILAAANQAFSEFLEDGEILPQSLACVRKLAWLELQLGRVPAALQWIDLASGVAQNLAITGKRRQAFLEERTIQDGILGILFLRADLPQLELLSDLPSKLELIGLELSRIALLYSLGHEDELRHEGTIPSNDDSEAVLDLICKWAKQPASVDMPSRPELGEGDQAVLRSRVLGCEVQAFVSNNVASICLAEWILAAVEGLLATSLDAGLFTHAQNFSLKISAERDLAGTPEYRFEKVNGSQVLVIRHREPDSGRGGTGADPRFVQKIILEVLPRIALPRDVQKYGEQVLGREEGFSRAITFSDPGVPLHNILGDKIARKISEWKSGQSYKTFPLRRNVPWSHGLVLEPQREKATGILENLGEGEPPPDLLDFSDVKHTQVRIFSLIDMPLWDKAGWHGIAFAFSPDLKEPPIMSLVFRNAEVAKEIFEGWRAKLGEVDDEDQLHLAIVTGVDKRFPHSYAVVIGSNPASTVIEGLHHTVHVSRIHRMDPQDSRNLNVFVPRYERLGRYVLVPAYYAPGLEQPEFFHDLWIGKQALRVVPAWRLGSNDPDGVGIRPDDDPIVPDGIENAPILGLLERRKARTARSQSG